jgi:hypothetical protein
MESAVIASICSRQEIPFGCLRAVSDRMETALSPQMVSLLSGAGISWSRLLAMLVRHPPVVGELWRLAAASRRASRQLAKGLGEILTLTLPWGATLE